MANFSIIHRVYGVYAADVWYYVFMAAAKGRDIQILFGIRSTGWLAIELYSS